MLCYHQNVIRKIHEREKIRSVFNTHLNYYVLITITMEHTLTQYPPNFIPCKTKTYMETIYTHKYALCNNFYYRLCYKGNKNILSKKYIPSLPR